MNNSTFELEQAWLDAARGLPPPQFEEFQRLTRSLLHGPPFQLLLLDCHQDDVRRDLCARLDLLMIAVGWQKEYLQLDEAVPDAAALERELDRLSGSAQTIQVLGGSSWLSRTRLDDLNQRRERLAGMNVRLIFWLDAPSIARWAEQAQDLWSWRSGIYAFSRALPDPIARPGFDIEPSIHWDANVSMAQRHRRIAQVKDMLTQIEPIRNELRAPLVSELAQLLYETGQISEAIDVNRNQLAPTYQRLGDLQGQVRTLDSVVAILIERGDTDGALRLLRDDVQPLLAQLKDDRALAIAQSRMADVMKHRGDNPRAFEILSGHVLPAVQRLGDGHLVAATLGKMAMALHHSGRSDQALNILQEQVIPLVDQLQHPHTRALVMGAIAEIAHDRGQIDKALKIRREEQLPIFERLGDIRWRALTFLKIAEELQMLGDASAAVAVLRDEAIPVFERLGDTAYLAWAQVALAKNLLARNRTGDRDEARRLLVLAKNNERWIGSAHENTLAEVWAKVQAS